MEETENHPTLAKVANFSEWAANTTESMELGIVSLIENNKPSELVLFGPEFTYPFFGSHETAFGYKDLKINILFAGGSLRTFLNIEYSSKYQQLGSSTSGDSAASADDLFDMLKKQMSSDITTNYDTFLQGVQEDMTLFKPIGEKIHEYQLENEEGEEETFEIYKSSFENPKFRDYHRRMQIFVLLFIEGSSYIEDDDEKWEIYTLYKKEKSGDSYIYNFVGYTTAYPFYCWPELTRMRISQFLILPPYQSQGHGHQLYQTIYGLFSKRSDVCEITVEDPNEGFQDLRDKCDLRYLQEHNAFNDIFLPIPQITIQNLQKQFKLTNRQTQGCIEMYLLSKLNKLDKASYKAYRLQVKQRLYKFNYDALQELEPEIRKEKLHETYCSVEQDYHRLIERL